MYLAKTNADMNKNIRIASKILFYNGGQVAKWLRSGFKTTALPVIQGLYTSLVLAHSQTASPLEHIFFQGKLLLIKWWQR